MASEDPLSRAWALLEALGECLAGQKWEAEKLCLGLPLRRAEGGEHAWGRGTARTISGRDKSRARENQRCLATSLEITGCDFSRFWPKTEKVSRSRWVPVHPTHREVTSDFRRKTPRKYKCR